MIGLLMFAAWLFGFFSVMLAGGAFGLHMEVACGLALVFPSVALLIWILMRTPQQPAQESRHEPETGD